MCRTNKQFLKTVLLPLMGALLIAALPVESAHAAATIPIVDAHSQVDDDFYFADEDLDTVITRMNDNGVTHTILAPRADDVLFDGAILELATLNPEMITPAVMTKGPCYNGDLSLCAYSTYEEFLDAQIATPGVAAMEEVLIYHSGSGSSLYEIPIEDERVQLVYSRAVSNGWPFIAHIEFQDLLEDYLYDPTVRGEYMRALENLLSSDTSQPVVLIHMGQLGPDEARRLIETHPNIYFMTSSSNPYQLEVSGKSWENMFEGTDPSYTLKPQWKALLTEYPRRFIFALDNVRYSVDWTISKYFDQITLWRDAFDTLPKTAAHAVAHCNAERLWNNVPPQGGFFDRLACLRLAVNVISYGQQTITELNSILDEIRELMYENSIAARDRLDYFIEVVSLKTFEEKIIPPFIGFEVIKFAQRLRLVF